MKDKIEIRFKETLDEAPRNIINQLIKHLVNMGHEVVVHIEETNGDVFRWYY